MDFFASWARRALSVRAAEVSLVGEDTRAISDASALPKPPACERSMTLSQSLCHRVSITAAPLVIDDTRLDPRMPDSSVASDTGVRAYAGAPLTDRHGRVLGALYAVDDAPRQWTEDEVDTLLAIARACSAELRLRLADLDASQEEDRHDEVQAGQRRALDRSQILLSASQAFTDTLTVSDVRSQITDILTAAFSPAHLDVAVLDSQGRPHPDSASGRPGAWSPGTPTSAVAEHRQILHYPDRGAFDRAFPGASGDDLRSRGLRCIAVVPLSAPDGAVGAVLLGWTTPHFLDSTDLLTAATIAGYAGHALDRARHLSHRTSVAHQMQEAMLTTLPKVRELDLAARYLPADSGESVGGDWYDAVPIADPARPDDDTLLLSVGDIVGHSIAAVTVMGQARCMLRQAAADHAGGPPSLILDSFESANRQFDIGAGGTAIVALLGHESDGHRSITWTNAGHPPPVLLHPDGTNHLLDQHDPLFGFELTAPGERTDHRLVIPPGSLLFFYTDGLVERRDSDLDAGTDRLIRLLESVRDREPQKIVDTAVDTLVDDAHDDDVVAFAIRLPADEDR